jgi:EAL domain-containing protein (putative c-di-GMP-specific phosphodiesterase class I)
LWSEKVATRELTIAVNVSARQFKHPEFVQQVKSLLSTSGADPQCLKLELTESLLLGDTQDAILKMTELKAIGVSFALDDFGTGYSSLSYLKLLPLKQLKIDQSFVRDVMTDPNDAAIARTVLALGHSLGLTVVAEGVETEAQRAFLAQHGCRLFQGYLFGRPVPIAQLQLQLTAESNVS